ncbi:MAG TPA: hypothetical protein VHT74_24985 [Acetobacteraceae bacterium]|jgi:hypothetical protein|nr:hypothetical protein [Acetobacteraceae bacterium]
MTGKPDHPAANEGEGSRTAAQAYNRDAKAFAESGKVEPAARDAKRALHSKDAKKMQEAERIGKAHSHGEDPALKR